MRDRRHRCEDGAMKRSTLAGVRLLLAATVASVALPAPAQTPPAPAKVGLANPASQHCAQQGGALTVEKNGAGGEFGVCTFGDNLQCEEWAMLRGQCRTGGIKVTGYVTAAARYCALTGGSYAVTSGSNAADEQGTCTLPGGQRCAAAAYFDQTCGPGPAARAVPPPAPTIRAVFTCNDGKSIDASFVNGAPSHVVLRLSDGRRRDLPQAMSASGARYANADESFVFWNKGNTAFVEEGGRTTYSGCVTRP